MIAELDTIIMHTVKWYFSQHELEHTPSRKMGITAEKELGYRQQSAKLVQDMGQRLQVSQLAINTAIVYMHRFYMRHTFTRFHRHSIAPASLFLAAKVEEQPRKLEHVIKIASYFVNPSHVTLDVQSDAYAEKAQELVTNENILLQTLGFDVAIDHPHTYVVKCFQMVQALSNLPQTSYFMATNSLHMTTMCLQYKPAVVACVCIDIVCKWSNYEIQRYSEGKDWFVHVDPSVTAELLEKLSAEFIAVLDKFPNRLRKVRSMNSVQHGVTPSLEYRPRSSAPLLAAPSRPSSTSNRSQDPANKEGVSSKPQHPPSAQKTVLSHKEYTEKREKERRERERHSAQTSSTLHPVSSTSQRAQLDQLRMPPPQAVPVGRPPNSSRDAPHPRKEPNPSDKQDRDNENYVSVKCDEDKIYRDQKYSEKISEQCDLNKVPDRTKPRVSTKPKIESKPLKQEATLSKLTPSQLNTPKLSIKESLQQPSSTDINSAHISVAAVSSGAAIVPAVIKKEPLPHASQSSNKVKPVAPPAPFYHPRLDGKPKSNKPATAAANLPQPSQTEEVVTIVPKSSQQPSSYNPKDDVTTISSISKLLSQSITTRALKEQPPDVGPSAISSTSHPPSKRHKSEHSHKHSEKDKKKKKSKHKSKDKKEKREKEKDSKDHKKSKKQKKHKEKSKERDAKDSKYGKPVMSSAESNEVDTSNTPIKLTKIREKGVYTPEASQIPMAKTATPNLLTDVSSQSGSAAMSSIAGSGGLKTAIPKSLLQSGNPSPPRGIPPRDNHPKQKLMYDRDSRKRDRSPHQSLPPNKYMRTFGGINLQKVGNQTNPQFSQNIPGKRGTPNQFKGNYRQYPPPQQQQQPYRETTLSTPAAANFPSFPSYPPMRYTAPPPNIISRSGPIFPTQHLIPAADRPSYNMYYAAHPMVRPPNAADLPMINYRPPPVTFNVPPPGYPLGAVQPVKQQTYNPPLPYGSPPRAPPPPPE